MVVSRSIGLEYQRQVPSSKLRFVCTDCGASFDNFHLLSNHIHAMHVVVEEEEARINAAAAKLTSAAANDVRKGRDVTETVKSGGRRGRLEEIDVQVNTLLHTEKIVN